MKPPCRLNAFARLLIAALVLAFGIAGTSRAEQFSNFALTTLASGIGNSDTSLTVASVNHFPSLTPFRLIIQDSVTTTPEIVMVTAISGNTYTVTRGLEGTAPSAHAAGAQVAQFVTAGVISDMVYQINNGGGGSSIGIIRKSVNALASNTVYAAGVTSYSSGTFTAPKGAQPLPTMLAAGQVFFVDFNQSNPAAANLVIGNLASKPIKVLNALGSPLTLVGGEIVQGPATLYFDGTQFIYSAPVAVNKPVTGAVNATQADFTGHTTFYLPSGAETITLPCSNTVSPNGQIEVFSVSGTATVTKGSGCSDTITKSGSSGNSVTIAAGAGLAAVVPDGSANFYVSGP